MKTAIHRAIGTNIAAIAAIERVMIKIEIHRLFENLSLQYAGGKNKVAIPVYR